MTTTGKLHTENKVIQLYPQNKYKYTHPIQTDERKIPRAKPTLRGSVISKRVLMNKGRLKTRVRFCGITNPPVGTTFRLRFKRIQPNSPALVGIGADGQGFAVFDALE